MKTPDLSEKTRGGARRRMAAVLAMTMAAVFASQGAAQSVDGKTVYKDANCVGCHKWHGQGGGGYGGAALSLRETDLDREQLIEVIVCGRMETRMPYHLRAAWKTGAPCYGMTSDEIGDEIPPKAANFLRDHQIEAVADYVIGHMQGRGDPTKEECVEFWGEGSRECGRY